MTLTITNITNTVQDQPDFDGHETVILAEDSDIKFRAYIAVHNTSRGPALGGCRYWSRYTNDDEAITDVLRLSRGMTYKNALADLPLGGGKAVIMGPPGTRNPTPDQMKALGRAVESLQGRYITAEDVGMSVDHMLIARGTTRHVSGLPLEVIAAEHIPATLATGEMPEADPSPYTAFGVFEAMRAGVLQRFGRNTMKDLRISVKGYGNVAQTLCKLLDEAGAVVTVSEIDDGRIAQAKADGFHVLAKGMEIMSYPADIYAPCALGGDIRDETIQLLHLAGVKLVNGAANNQLARPHHAERLLEKGILYTPDYLANAGGVISVGVQQIWADVPAKETFPTHAKLMHRIGHIYNVAQEVFQRSQQTGANTAHIANQIAEERFMRRSPAKDKVRAA
ncbi:MAG: leucine dehydrogenase [Micavibrio sp.]|nr:leucine dehydrogenase [Micavibrio sp.]